MGGPIESQKTWYTPSVLIAGLMLFFAYLLLPPYLRQELCPADTFLSGPIGREIGVVGDFLIPPSFFALAFLAGNVQSSVSSWIKRHRALVAMTASCALLLSAALWINLTFSFYCATPLAVLLHSDVLRTYRKFTWDDVQVVRARCWAGSRTPWQAGFNISFVDGEEILLPFGYRSETRNRNYEAIRIALQRNTYRYDRSEIKACPHNLYAILAHWPNALR